MCSLSQETFKKTLCLNFFPAAMDNGLDGFDEESEWYIQCFIIHVCFMMVCIKVLGGVQADPG